VSPAIPVTVRHTPSWQTESPTVSSASGMRPGRIVNVTASPRRSAAATVPTSSTSPVNTFAVYHSVAQERATAHNRRMSAARLSRLRYQMLLALGGCWTSPTPAGPVTIAEAPRPPVKVDFDPRACAIDEIVETACGTLDEAYRTCGAKGDRLAGIDEPTLVVSDESDVRGFSFDRGATSSYRATIDDDDASQCCYSSCTKLTVAASAPSLPIPPGFHQTRTCIPMPPGGTSAPAVDEPRCPAAVSLAGKLAGYVTGDEQSCCYLTVAEDPRNYIIKGRAARVDGTPVTAGIGTDGAWCAELELAAVPAELRARLAGAWREAARMEHASIASFSALSLRLLALGAPPELVAGTHAAALDEVRHAQLAFAIASAYAGEAIGPSAFGAVAQLATGGTLADLARETLIDGCVGETIAALEADVAADGATDPAVASALRGIAIDEARHAQLAWAIVGWAVRKDPSLAPMLREAFASISEAPMPAADAAIVPHGVLDGPALAAVRADALRAIVAPCLASL